MSEQKLSEKVLVEIGPRKPINVPAYLLSREQISERIAALEAGLSKMDELESERDMLRTVLNDTDKAELLEGLEQSTKEALTLREQVDELEEQYGDLLLTVVTKHEDETRHETARRYIFEAENRPAREALAGEEA